MGETVRGKCPMGCGDTLFLGSGGYVTCSLDRCPNPTAMCDVMLDHADPWHIVVLEAGTFKILHPLRERLGDDLFSCALHKSLEELDGPPRKPGRYEVRGDGPWHWREAVA